jgi:hypothetical protein
MKRLELSTFCMAIRSHARKLRLTPHSTCIWVSGVASRAQPSYARGLQESGS